MKRSVYLSQPGVLKCLGDALCFNSADGNSEWIPLDDAREILIYGDVAFDKPLLDCCTDNRIILHFFDRYGYYSGSYYPRLHHNSAFVTLKQAEHHMDYDKRLAIALSLARGAVGNILHVLQYHHELGDDVLVHLREVEAQAALLDGSRSLDLLRKIVGTAREVYYSSLDVLLDLPDFRFRQRSRQPPDNPLNALISFGNSLLYAQALSCIYQTRLDPRIGFLHDKEFDRFNLHLDVAEVFKPILVGRTIFVLLVERQELTKADFVEEKDGILLTDRGKQVFLAEWEARLAKAVSQKNGDSMASTYRELIKTEMDKLERHASFAGYASG